MKVKKFTITCLIALYATLGIQAQVLFHEDFDYPAGRPLILNPEAGVANFDELTQWTTYSNAFAAIETFTITEEPLSYEGYSEGVGNALYYNGIQGGGVFKPLSELIIQEETFYVSFLVNFQEGAASGADFMLGMKMNPGAADFNWGSRLFAMDDFVSGDFMIGINKLSGGTTTWGTEGPFIKPEETYLFVIKYEIGEIVGESLAEERGHYDDVMSLFVNPEIAENEPEVPTLKHVDPAQSDIRRWGNTTVFGGAHSFYLRAPAEGLVPKYIIDDIRVGRTWQDVIQPTSTSVENLPKQNVTYFLNNQQLKFRGLETARTDYRVFSMTGQTLLTGAINNDEAGIDVSGLKKGIYIVQLGTDLPTAIKVLIP